MSNNNGSGTWRCAVCERKVSSTAFVGMQMNLEGKNDSEIKRATEMFGSLNLRICLTCWLLSLGLKPISCDNNCDSGITGDDMEMIDDE